MANNYGFTSVNQQVTSRSGGQNDLVNSINELNNKVTSGRVIDIILDENHPLFETNGEWSSLGTIFFEKVDIANATKSPLPKTRALPLLPNIKQYPVINEVVLIFELPSKEIGLNSTLTAFYYINSISIWNHPNLNAYPNELTTPQVQPSQNKSYQQIEAGQVRRNTNEEVKINYNSPLVGGSFVPSNSVRSLMPYAGDFILEGRFGNSIRFGSTISGSTSNYTSSIINNNWSSVGSSGEPITIIRNGQGEEDSKNPISSPVWVPTVENINIDKSSIYLTSNQIIPLSTTFNSYPAIKNNKPTTIQAFSGSQVLLSSDRLIFNAKNDSIIANSENIISLNAISDIGLLSRNGQITLQAERVSLGDASATESLIYGDQFMFDFKNLIAKLQNLCTNLALEPKLVLSSGAANNVMAQIQLMLNKIDNYTSKTSKTI